MVVMALAATRAAIGPPRAAAIEVATRMEQERERGQDCGA